MFRVTLAASAVGAVGAVSWEMWNDGHPLNVLRTTWTPMDNFVDDASAGTKLFEFNRNAIKSATTERQVLAVLYTLEELNNDEDVAYRMSSSMINRKVYKTFAPRTLSRGFWLGEGELPRIEVVRRLTLMLKNDESKALDIAKAVTFLLDLDILYRRICDVRLKARLEDERAHLLAGRMVALGLCFAPRNPAPLLTLFLSLFGPWCYGAVRYSYGKTNDIYDT
jgi:hypothetical protein